MDAAFPELEGGVEPSRVSASALAASEAERRRLLSILDRAPVAMVIVSGAGDLVTFANAATRAQAGGEVVGVSVREAYRHLDSPVFFELLERARREGAPQAAHEVHLRWEREGQPFEGYFNVTCEPLPEPERSVPDVLVASVDVTAQVLARRRIARSEQRFHALVDATSQMIWTTDAAGACVEDSPSWRAFTGQTEEEWLGWGWLQALHPDDRERARAAWQDAVAGKRSYEVEYRVRRADGEYRATLARGVPVLDERGAILEWIGRNTDVTLPRELERELEAERALLQEILLHMPAGVGVRSAATFDFVLVNERLREITRGDPRDFLHGPEGAQLPIERHPIVRAMTSGQRIEKERFHYLHEDGSWSKLDVSAAPLRDPKGALVAGVGIFEDVTARVEAEAALREREAGLSRLSELQQLLLGVIGHDLRNPLSAVLFRAAQLQGAEHPDAARKLAARIADSAGRALRILDTLVDFTQARMGGGLPVTRTAGDLAPLCQAIVEDFEAAASGREIACAARGNTRFSFDAARLSQLVGNLVSNALQYGTPGTKVSVRLSGGEGEVVLEVHNLGAAIPAALLPALFEPYKRGGGGAGRNLGLGLYIVREIALAHGGSVEARSDAEAGTTFTVRLPRTPAGR